MLFMFLSGFLHFCCCFFFTFLLLHLTKGHQSICIFLCKSSNFQKPNSIYGIKYVTKWLFVFFLYIFFLLSFFHSSVGTFFFLNILNKSSDIWTIPFNGWSRMNRFNDVTLFLSLFFLLTSLIIWNSVHFSFPHGLRSSISIK